MSELVWGNVCMCGGGDEWCVVLLPCLSGPVVMCYSVEHKVQVFATGAHKMWIRSVANRLLDKFIFMIFGQYEYKSMSGISGTCYWRVFSRKINETLFDIKKQEG